jgi:hypothetical protein
MELCCWLLVIYIWWLGVANMRGGWGQGIFGQFWWYSHRSFAGIWLKMRGLHGPAWDPLGTLHCKNRPFSCPVWYTDALHIMGLAHSHEDHTAWHRWHGSLEIKMVTFVLLFDCRLESSHQHKWLITYETNAKVELPKVTNLHHAFPNIIDDLAK